MLVDADGFTAVYDRYAPEHFRFCARRVGPTVAEDVVANTFLVAYERWDRFDPTRADTPAWLYGIGVNLLRRYRRDEVRWYRALARTGNSLVRSSPGSYDGLFVNRDTGRIIGDFASVDKAQAIANATQWSYGVATQPGVAP